MSKYCKDCYKLAEQLHRYKQAIEDIKEIAESCSWNNGESLLFSRMEQIIEKCEEINAK